MTLSRKQSGVRFMHAADETSLGAQAAALVGDWLSEHPETALVFPTGNTPKPMYRVLRNRSDLDWGKSRLFHLDEYVPPPDAAGSPPYETFAEAIRHELWDHIGGQAHFFRDYTDCPDDYEALVTAHGGPGLVILGIGRNGHVAFNEPPCGPDAPTRRIALSDSTLRANFGLPDAETAQRKGYPTQAVTLGLRAILSASRILLLATGDNKHEVIRRAFDPRTPPTPDCPASWLKQHPDIIVLTDFPVFP